MLWINGIQEDEVLSCSEMFTAALTVQKNNIHAEDKYCLCGEAYVAQQYEFIH